MKLANFRKVLYEMMGEYNLYQHEIEVLLYVSEVDVFKNQDVQNNVPACWKTVLFNLSRLRRKKYIRVIKKHSKYNALVMSITAQGRRLVSEFYRKMEISSKKFEKTY
jgi:hypothetical protein